MNYTSVPINMLEVAEKMEWNQQHGVFTTEDAVIEEAILENAQDMLNGDLEGAYWKASWTVADQQLTILDVLGKEVASLSPLHASFTKDFRNNAPEVMRYLSEEIQRIVNEH